MLKGALGFCIPSLAVFGSWALAGRWMYRTLTEAGAYAVWAFMFIGLAGVVLHRLLVKCRKLGWFQGVFAVAFLLYAIGWSAAWFALRNHAGEWLGPLVGTTLMTFAFASAFKARPRMLRMLMGLFLAHSTGYFLGGMFYANIAGSAGKMLWGLCYGLGFGAGIGWALHHCQSAYSTNPSDPLPLPPQ